VSAGRSIDRREAYYERAARLIAADPLGFYTRAEEGRRVQSRIKRGDYVTPKPVSTNVINWPWSKVNRA
jgi:hypothetical protein